MMVMRAHTALMKVWIAQSNRRLLYKGRRRHRHGLDRKTRTRFLRTDANHKKEALRVSYKTVRSTVSRILAHKHVSEPLVSHFLGWIGKLCFLGAGQDEYALLVPDVGQRL
jgi:hypothetical protein